MKRISAIIFIICLLGVGLHGTVSLSFSPSQIRVNELKTLSFDPIMPQAQPLLTTLTISNKGAADKINLEIALSWNGEYIIHPGEARFISKEELGAGDAPLVLTNRDMISQEGSQYFDKDGDINIDIFDILSDMSNLKDAALAGSFPDGILAMEVKAKPSNARSWKSSRFTITVRNLNSITLLSPGKPIGQLAPQVNDLPASFYWQVQKTDFNKNEYLRIFEFPPSRPPTITNIETAGRKVYDEIAFSGFSEFLPFNDGYTYAWQVYMPLYDIYNPSLEDKRNPDGNVLRSNWYVFQYNANKEDAEAIDEFQAALNMLNNRTIDNARNLGYIPLGEVIIEGRTYRGMEAIDAIMDLIGTVFDAELMP